MQRSFCKAIAITACATVVAISVASAQSFREPILPNVPNEPLTIVGDLQQSISPAGLNSNQSGFVPRAGGDSLGLVPVQPRNGQPSGQEAQMLAPEFSGGRTERDRRLLNQIREGKFEDSVPGLDPAEEGPKTIRQRYPDGKIQLIRQVVQDGNGNYINNGPWRLFNQRGELIARGQFADGLMDGTWERWHPAGAGGMFTSEPFTKFQGPFISTATFSKGKLDGVWIVSDRTSRKVLEVPYSQGKRHGPATWFYPSSERLRTVNFRDGLLDGPLMEWDDQNRIVRNDEYIKGQKVVRVTAFFAPKQLRSETYYLEGKLVLEGEDSWWDGEPAEYVLDGVRVQHGPTVAWHSNGQRKMAGQYRDDERVGLFVWWHENGTRALAGRYKDGFKEGTWSWWHPNGMKSIEGQYEDDVAVGQWIWWSEDGEVTDREDFGDGVKSIGDLPDPATENESDDSNEQDSGGGLSDNPPEGGMPDEREENRPYPDPFNPVYEEEQGVDGAAGSTEVDEAQSDSTNAEEANPFDADSDNSGSSGDPSL